MRAILFLTCIVCACSPSGERHPDIAHSSVCDSCAIDVQIVWTSKTGDGNILGEGWPLEVGDTLWMLGEMFGPAILRLPLDGGASTLIERKGDGPGEFRRIVGGQVYSAEDTIVIVQDSRVSYITRELREVRSFPNLVPRPKGLIVLQDGTLVSTNPQLSRPAQATGFALHVTSPQGEYVGSFRPVDSPYNVGIWPMALAGKRNTIWVVESRPTGLVAELWDAERAERIHVLNVNPDWWVSEGYTPEDYERMAARKAAELKLPSGAVGVWDSGDVLWVALRQFDADNPGVDFANAAVHEWFDGVLLALDKHSGDILATAVFDDFLLGFTNRGRLVLYNEDGNGQPRVRLAETVLRQ